MIFDHDGTLVDSEIITLSVVADIATNHGAEVYPEDPERFVGADLHVVFDEIERRSGKRLPNNIMEVFRERQTAMIRDGLQEIEGASELLSGLRLPCAVASNAPVAKMELCLGATDLLRFIDDGHLISAYDVEAWKPDPAVFLRAAEVLGVDPAECIVVEDSRPGVLGGVAAGMTVFALDPHGRFDDIDGITAIERLSELKPLLH